MRDLTVAELAESVIGCQEVLRRYHGFDVTEVDVVNFQAALRALIAEPETPTGLHIDHDGNGDLTLWDGSQVVARECDVSERAWDLLVAQVTAQNDTADGVTPDSPAPDDRPLKVGDRVKVADDGERYCGRTGTVERIGSPLRVVDVRSEGFMPFNVMASRLTRLPDEEASR